MYDRRLDGIVAAAELGSFSRAAERLSLSTPALVKQVSGFEAEHGLTVFSRSHSGVELTAAGESLVADARSIMRMSEEALRRARSAASGSDVVRMGVSLMSPGRQTLNAWPQIHEAQPERKLELVPTGSLYVEDSLMFKLGQDVDVIQTSFSTVRWEGACNLLYLFDVPMYVDVPRTCPVALLSEAHAGDLAGLRVRVLKHTHDSMDELREGLLATEGVEVADVDAFDIELFNDAMERGDGVLTSGAWSGVHPGFVGVPLAGVPGVPCYLAYPLNPAPHVARFVEALAHAVESGAFADRA